MILAAHINSGGVEDSSDVTAVICTANIIFFSLVRFQEIFQRISPNGGNKMEKR
jgi:hypothetical protein